MLLNGNRLLHFPAKQPVNKLQLLHCARVSQSVTKGRSGYDMIRYSVFNMQSVTGSQLSLPHGIRENLNEKSSKINR